MRGRNWKLRFEDMLEAIRRIERYIAGISYEEFCQDQKTIDAVVRNLEIIGEAARHISKEVRDKYPDLPWEEMSGMRNILIHEYFGVSLPIIWHTITSDLPPVVRLLEKILEQHD